MVAYMKPEQKQESKDSVQKKESKKAVVSPNQTGIPDAIKSRFENLSGFSFDDVRVHYNSDKPAQMQTFAYTQGNQVYVAPRQEKYLGHELGHVVQQKQGRVRPTKQLQGVNINNNENLEREVDALSVSILRQNKNSPNRKKLKKVDHAVSDVVFQGKFYFKSQRLTKDMLKEEITSIVEPTYGKSATAQKRCKIKIAIITDAVWSEYGEKDDFHMEIKPFTETLKKQEKPIDEDKLIADLKSIAQGDIDTPQNFKKRIRSDSRLPQATRKEYVKAFSEFREKPAAFEAVKAKVKEQRKEWVSGNIKEADEELRKGKYFKEEQKTDFRTIEIDSKLKGKEAKLLQKVEARVLGMKDKLKAAWYYNQANAKEIFASHELRSYKEREKLAGGSVDSKSMAVDVQDNKTGGYFYSFIEHEDSAFNQNTRFTEVATKDGALGSTATPQSKRRLRIPLRKMVKSGAMIMGGDLASDRQETQKMGLKQNETPTKLFASGKSKEDDVEQQINGLLRNYVRFVARRIYEAKPYWISPLRLTRTTKGEEALAKLKDIDTMTDKDLWEYLVREIAQPQLMTPMKVSTSMKGIRIDMPS